MYIIIYSKVVHILLHHFFNKNVVCVHVCELIVFLQISGKHFSNNYTFIGIKNFCNKLSKTQYSDSHWQLYCMVHQQHCHNRTTCLV